MCIHSYLLRGRYDFMASSTFKAIKFKSFSDRDGCTGNERTLFDAHSVILRSPLSNFE